MKSINKLRLLATAVVAGLLLSGCHNIGNNTQELEVQSKIIAKHGIQTEKSLLSSDGIIADFKDIAHGNNMYMIVGSQGAIYTSPDAYLWTEQVGVTKLNLNAVAYNEKYKKFYAVGDAGKLFTSADGVSWIEYKTLNQSIDLHSISILSDGNEIIGGDKGNIFEISFRGDDGEKSTVNVREMQSKTGYEDSIVAAVSSGATYMVSGSKIGTIANKEIEDFRSGEWEYNSSTNSSGVADIFYSAKKSSFTALSKDGYINTSNANTYNSPWSSLAYTNYPAKSDYQLGITTNSFVIDQNSPYSFVVGGGKENSQTFIHYTKDINNWDNKDIQYPKTGSLNKVRCFSADPEPMCIAVGDKEAIVIIKIKNDHVDPEPIDITKPKIISFIPNNGAKNVALNPLMDITFNKPVKNVNDSTISLYENNIDPENKVTLSTFAPSSNQDDYTFSPAHMLKSSTHYIVAVTAGITDKYGKKVAPENFSFDTGNISIPEVKVVDPADKAVAVNSLPNISVVFSEPVKNVDAKNVSLHEGSDTGKDIEISNPKAFDEVSYIFAPTKTLKPITKYCMVFDSGITNVYDIGIRKHVSCFTTSSDYSLSVKMLRPEDNDTNVTLLPEIDFKFNHNVTNVTSKTVTLHEGSADGAVINIADVTYNSGNQTYGTHVKSLLKINTVYYVVFSSEIKDADNPEVTLPEASYSFKTRGDGIAAVAGGEECIYTITYTKSFNCVRKLTYIPIRKIVFAKKYDKYVAVGDKGNIYVSNNSSSWTPLASGTTNNLNNITALNDNEPYVIAVGNKGTILVSSDMGQTWVNKSVPGITADLKAIHSTGTEFTIPVDGKEWLYSDDKGQTWQKKTDIAELPTSGVQNIFEINGDYAIAGGANGQVYTSKDKMKSWTPATSVQYKFNGSSAYSSYTRYIYAYDKFDNFGVNILLGNNNTMFTSTNNGLANNQWTRITEFDNTSKVIFSDISMNSYGELYMVTLEGNNMDGSLYVSNNGIDWTNVVKLRTDALYSVIAVD